MSHLNVITVAYWGSNFSKKHCFYSWPVYATMIFEKKIHLAEWGAFYQMGKFSHFQGSISSLFLKQLLRLSLLTYRNSYFIYPKNLFSMTLNLSLRSNGTVYLFILLEVWGAKFSKMSHLHVATIAYCSLKLSKSIDSTLGQCILQGYLKKIHLAEWGIYYQKGGILQIFKAQYLRYL